MFPYQIFLMLILFIHFVINWKQYNPRHSGTFCLCDNVTEFYPVDKYGHNVEPWYGTIHEIKLISWSFILIHTSSQSITPITIRSIYRSPFQTVQ